MKHQCKIMVLETKVFPEYQEKYLADPKSGSCPYFHTGDEFVLDRTPEKEEEKEWLDKQDFSNSVDNAYTG